MKIKYQTTAAQSIEDGLIADSLLSSWFFDHCCFFDDKELELFEWVPIIFVVFNIILHYHKPNFVILDDFLIYQVETYSV